MSARPRSRRLVAAFVIAVAVLAGLLGALSESALERAGSAASGGERGRRAAYRALAALGFAPERWTKAPGALPAGSHVLVVPSVPEPPGGVVLETDGAAERHDPERDPLLGGAHDLAHYARFVRQGGTLVMPLDGGPKSDADEVRHFLADVLELEGADDLAIDLSGHGAERVVFPDGLELEVDAGRVGRLAAPPRGHPAEPLVVRAGAPTEPVVLVVGAGRGGVGLGQVALLGRLDFLDNAELGERDHGLFAVRLLEALGPGAPPGEGGARLLLDEYALGVYTPDSVGGLALSGGLRAITLHVLALLALLVWAAAWVREFPRDPEPLAELSALARARARAGLCLRAGRADLLDALARRGVLHRVLERARLASARRDRAFPASLEALAAEADGADLPGGGASADGAPRRAAASARARKRGARRRDETGAADAAGAAGAVDAVEAVGAVGAAGAVGSADAVGAAGGLEDAVDRGLADAGEARTWEAFAERELRRIAAQAGAGERDVRAWLALFTGPLARRPAELAAHERRLAAWERDVLARTGAEPRSEDSADAHTHAAAPTDARAETPTGTRTEMETQT